MIRDPNGGPPKIFRVTKEEREILDKYIEHGAISQVEKALGVTGETVRDFLARPEVKEYLTNIIRHAAEGVDLTANKVLTKLNEIIDSDGSRKFEPSYLKALDMAARITKLITPAATNINLAQVQGGPFVGMNDEEFDKEFKSRIQYHDVETIGDKKDGGTESERRAVLTEQGQGGS